MIVLQRVAHREVGSQLVAITAANARTRNVPAGEQLRDDPLSRPLSDANPDRDIPDPDSRIARDTNQNVPVVGQERPGTTSSRRT